MSMSKTRLVSLAAIGAALGAATLTLAASVAAAYPDARVETTLRPDFGLLVRPPIHHHHRLPWGDARFGPGYGPGPRWIPHGWDHDPYGPDFGLERITIDCGDPSLDPDTLNLALAHLAPGGTLYLHHTGGYRSDAPDSGACKANLVIHKPVTIEGDLHPSDVRYAPIDARPLLSKGTDGVCIEVDLWGERRRPGVATNEATDKVVLRNLAIETSGAGQDSCIESHDSSLEIIDSIIRYDGTGTAVDVEGGWVHISNTVVTGGQRAVLLDEVAGAKLTNLTRLVSLQDSPVDSGGLVIKGHYQGDILVDDSFICGYKTGLMHEGPSSLTLTNSWICRASEGIFGAGSGGSLTVRSNTIATRGVGIRLRSEILQDISDNTFFGDPGGDIVFDGETPRHPPITHNHFLSSNKTCEWRSVDDSYFGGHRRPRRHGWQQWEYLPHYHHQEGWGTCEDPSYYGNRLEGIDLESAWFSTDPNNPNSYADWYGTVTWPDQSLRVGDPYDHVDNWDHPWWDQPH